MHIRNKHPISTSLHQFPHKKVIHLPHIHHHPQLYDAFSVSPQHIHINHQQKRQFPNHHQQPLRYQSKSNKFKQILRSGILQQDRIVQKHMEYDEEYNRIKKNIKQKVDRRRRSNQGLSLIYQRLIALL